MQFHRTSWTIRPARTWLCERGQTWRSVAPRRVHLSPVSPGVEKGVKIFPWATGKKVGVCDAFASVTHCCAKSLHVGFCKGIFRISETMHFSVTYTHRPVPMWHCVRHLRYTRNNKFVPKLNLKISSRHLEARDIIGVRFAPQWVTLHHMHENTF